jgi:hypothetical protein
MSRQGLLCHWIVLTTRWNTPALGAYAVADAPAEPAGQSAAGDP